MVKDFLYHTYQRYATLQTHRITALPIIILMPHSACNCRCIMCDIWKGNKDLKQLSENDIEGLLLSLKHLGTKKVVMSGGEALLNPHFFKFCEILKENNLSVSLLTTGLTLRQNASRVIELADDIIVSLDGNEFVHDTIRNMQGAYSKMRSGVQYLKSLTPDYPVTARTVIHKLNFSIWPSIIDSAKEIGFDQISFLPADVTSQAFNREAGWPVERQGEIMPDKDELDELRHQIDFLTEKYKDDFVSGFIAESPEKIKKIYTYYAALHGLTAFPSKKCNAPWVSAVVEADGTVKPCFFHSAIGNIRDNSIEGILNKSDAVNFRKQLDIDANETCKKCVCYLNLPPRMSVV